MRNLEKAHRAATKGNVLADGVAIRQEAAERKRWIAPQR
jgi:hypothetical protein